MIIEKWKQVSTEVTGARHIKKNLGCQDSTAYVFDKGIRVISLADGAGSVKHSKIGSEEIVKLIGNILIDRFFKYIILLEKNGVADTIYNANLSIVKKEIISSINTVLGKKALELNTSIDQLASTLLFVANYENTFLVGHLGDGAIGAYYQSNDIVKVISEPENGDQPNITFFTTDIDATDRLRLQVIKDNKISGLILMSDGPQTVFYDDKLGFIDETKVLFNNFKNKTSNNYQKSLVKFMESNLAKYTEDDQSFNILYLESIDLTEVSKDYFEYLTSDINNSNQFINRSSYCYYLEPLNLGGKKLSISSLKDIEDIINESKSR